MLMKLRVSSWLACVVITACGPSIDPVGDGGASASVGSSGASTAGEASASEAGNASTTEAGGASTSEAGDVSTTEAADSSGSTGECNVVCLAEFPCCGYEQSCVDASTIEVWVDLPCEEACEGFFCSCEGSSCRLQGEEPCPEGTWCVDTNRGAACQAAEALCGGPDGLACAAEELCEYVTGLCPECAADPEGCGAGSPVGTCVPRPAPDDVCPELDPDGDPFPPQCGCDGVLYANECERQRAAVPWADGDACR